MDTQSVFFVNSGFYLTNIQIALVFFVTSLSVVYIYSYFKNKNKNYPLGPVGVPVFGYLPFLGVEPHKTLYKLKEKYGNIIGLKFGRKYTVILNDWTAVKDVLAHSHALYRGSDIFSYIPYAGLMAANGKEWVEQRRFCLSTARDLGVGKGPWETVIMDELQTFIQYLQQFEGKPAEISHKLCRSVSSNMVSFLIGRRLRKEDEPEKVQLSVDFAETVLQYVAPTNVASVLPWLRKYFEMFKIAGYDRATKTINNFCQFVKDEISRHKTSPDFMAVTDFINSYLGKLSELTSASSETDHSFSEKMLVGHINAFFLGGSDTIFISLDWIFRLMAEHKDVQQKVYNELMTVFGKDGLARYQERRKIPYTFAVLMESQRFSSIVPLSTTRCAYEDIPIEGYVIPKGAEIVANLWALHNDPTYWDEPEKFKPERFLQDGGKTLIKSPPSYAPFSIGRRICPGETIAWMEILFYFSEIIKTFEISTENGETPSYDVINGLVTRLKPQPLCFKAREQQD